MAWYDLEGNLLSKAYRFDGSALDGSADDGSDNDDVIATTDYERTILSVKNSMMEEYDEDNAIVPILISTDQHGYLNNAHKHTFDFISRAFNWDKVSAILDLGDTCSGSYRETELTAFRNCVSSLPLNKQISVTGNHDVWLSGSVEINGTTYNMSVIDNDTLEYQRNTYFNNSAYGSDYEYKGMQLETMVDADRHIRYVCACGWNFPDGIYYHYNMTTKMVGDLIDMLSHVDDNDIIFLSHIQPILESKTWHHPAVDGGEETETTKSYGNTGTMAYKLSLQKLFSDRKAKRSGSITDAQGVVHEYDFTGCTSDFLCSLHGHQHFDNYTHVDGLPIVLFDAYRYDNIPMFGVNIDRTKQRLNIWKFDEHSNIYNYQIPM